MLHLAGLPSLTPTLTMQGGGYLPFQPSLTMQWDGQLSSTPLQMVTGPAGSCWEREGVQSSVIGRGGFCRTGVSKAGKPCSHFLMRQLVRQGLQPAAREGRGRGCGLGVFWKELPRQRKYQDKGWGAGGRLRMNKGVVVPVVVIHAVPGALRIELSSIHKCSQG